MIKNLIFIIGLIFLFNNIIYSQGEGNIWYFGENAGLDFNTGSPVAIINGSLNTIEGCASISTGAGHILFYTNGVNVYDSTHNVMLNGSGLLGDESSTQSSIIVPNPQSDTLYYVFTVGENGANGLRYSEVDITLNNGLGAIILSTKNTLLLDENGNTMYVTEKITAVKHADNISYWIIAHQKTYNKFYVYLLDAVNGLNTTPIAWSVGSSHQSSWGATHGYLKASPGGEYLGLAVHSLNNDGFFEVFDFNNASGEISNPRVSMGINRPYGVEFSPDGSKFYGTSISFPTNSHPSAIIQFDMNATNFAGSAITIDSSLIHNYMGMQIGPDGRIYITRNLESYLGIIENPNDFGQACGFINNGIYLNGNNSRYGLPTFMQSYFKEARIAAIGHCTNSDIQFEIYNSEGIFSVIWNFDDPSSGANNTSNLFDPVHVYSQSGTYEVNTILTYYGFTDTVYCTVEIFESPVFSLGNDTLIQPGTNLVLELDTGLGSFFWSTGEYTNAITISLDGLYIVTVTNQWECESSDEINIGYLGIETNEPGSTIVFPNPFDDEIYIDDISLNSFSYKLFNSYGELVSGGQSNRSSMKIITGHLRSGVYFLRIDSSEGIITFRAIKY